MPARTPSVHSRPCPENPSSPEAPAGEAAVDASLVRRFITGDESAFTEIVTRYRGRIYGLTLNLLHNAADAEEITQDTFIRAYRGLVRFRGDSSLSTWLYRIAINHCRNLQQTWNERHMLSNADDAVWETAAARTDSPLRVLETKELGQRIQQALDGLSPEYRLLLLLVADEQLSYEQVGALTEQTSDAVRGKLHRARKAFTVLFGQTA